ncbi:LysR family substrate-binding domain-containing protein [Acetobacter pasteurianus]|uniref:LysR family substrate-binding domain-containing protein n=1 Tax=Acetobacter pasteurianus TaxID=438 RepID=UPI00216AF64D|nr:LysR family substrate-binding domain-containing protein [Acetobacter pasteurianus]
MGRLTIGVHGSIASGFLTELRHRYRFEHPAIEQVITEGPSSQIIAMIRDDRLDVAFVVNARNLPDCHSRHLWSEDFIVVVPSGHRLAVKETITWLDLVSESFLVRYGGAGPQMFAHIVRRVTERGQSPCIHRRDVGRDTLMHMVAAKEGITLTSEAATPVPFPGVVLRSIADETEKARFSAVWSPHNRSPALRHLMDIAIGMSRSEQ